MAQNSFFTDAIEREAMKARTNAHPQNSFLVKDISLKTTQAFLITSYQLYRAILKLISVFRWSGKIMKTIHFRLNNYSIT